MYNITRGGDIIKDELQTVTRCLDCDLYHDYEEAKVTLEEARKKCAHCHLYKFDIITQLIRLKSSQNSATTQGKRNLGKKETYSRRYGTAITKLQAEGKTIRQIADILGISPTSVVKVANLMKATKTERTKNENH